MNRYQQIMKHLSTVFVIGALMFLVSEISHTSLEVVIFLTLGFSLMAALASVVYKMWSEK